ncbi:HupE/UreJ family protein [Leucothrix mucor]|uniref:HupE/UreJ family protein n=1 Tax=Leucothrix mucor TaxID=45248 RepID=UPI0003B770D8|nr:HupE/UreJ family protein [Leucothrix mucor]
MKQLTTRVGPIALLSLITPLSAWAIGGPSTNFFMQGLNHPLVIPAHLIVVFALGLLLGQQGWKQARVVLPTFIVVFCGALLMTRIQSVSWDTEMILLPLAGLMGILLTLKRQLPLVLPLTIAAIAAVVIGLDSSVPQIPGLQARKIYAHLSGSGVSISALLLVVTFIALALRNVLQGVILRILGAWCTAGALLVLALLLANVART